MEKRVQLEKGNKSPKKKWKVNERIKKPFLRSRCKIAINKIAIKKIKELPYADIFKGVSHFKIRLHDSYDHTRSCENLNMSNKIPHILF